MVSMETPRADYADINNRVLVANSLIRSIFYKKNNVSIIDNSNLVVQGQPILRFLNQSDKVHLSRQGTSMLANNIRSSLDARFGLRGNDRGLKAQPPSGRGIQHPGNRGGAGPAPLVVIFHLVFGMEVHLRDIIRTSALFKSILGS